MEQLEQLKAKLKETEATLDTLRNQIDPLTQEQGKLRAAILAAELRINKGIEPGCRVTFRPFRKKGEGKLLSTKAVHGNYGMEVKIEVEVTLVSGEKSTFLLPDTYYDSMKRL